MDQASVSDIVRGCFAAFLSGDRDTLDSLLSDDFTFTSPRDDHIDRAAFFERCLPGSDQFLTHQIERLFVEKDEAFVLYRAELKDGTTFRNVEYHRVEGMKIREVIVFFGPTLL